MLTSDPSCSSTSKSSVEREVQAEESGWTDCFSWDDLLYTGRDLATAQIKRVSHVEACNYELIAADATLAKEARECLIADQYTAAGAPHACNSKALRVRQFHDHEQNQQFVDGGLAYNRPFSRYCLGASSILASDASSGPPSSSLPPASSPQLMKMTTDAGALLNTMRIMDRATDHSKLGVGCKRARGAFHDSAVQDTCSKTRRIATQSINLHPAASSFSVAQPPATTSISQLQCSAAEAHASSHVMPFAALPTIHEI